MQSSIGVIDSGFGGLDVLRHLRQELPEYDYIYLADSLRAPYGDRPPAEIISFTRQAVQFVSDRGCKLIYIACNTAVSWALEPIQRELAPLPDAPMIIGVLDPCAKQAALATRAGRVGVLATTRTVESGAYTKSLQCLRPEISVFSLACPQLVTAIETENLHESELLELIRSSVHALEQHAVDTLILGCTHFGLVSHLFEKICASDTAIIQAGPIIAEHARQLFFETPSLAGHFQKSGRVAIYSTKPGTDFDLRAAQFLGESVHSQLATLT